MNTSGVMDLGLVEFRRKIKDITITVKAEYQVRDQLWAVSCRRNTKLYSTMQSDDPWADAQKLITQIIDDEGLIEEVVQIFKEDGNVTSLVFGSQAAFKVNCLNAHSATDNEVSA